MMDQAHFGEYLLRQQMLHAASLSSLREYLIVIKSYGIGYF